MAEKRQVSVSFNLNIPGFPKVDELYTPFFELCQNQLQTWLLANRIFIDEVHEETICHAAGDFYLVPIKNHHLKAEKLKQICETFEENHPLGRFLDVDVTDANGNNISSGKAKLCFYCMARPAMDCIHSKRHQIADLRAFQQQKIELYLKDERLKRISRQVSSMALRSILYEISLTPKPGLVDTLGNGVHKDMDYRLFLDSTAAISNGFMDLFNKGVACETSELEHALPFIRTIGLSMEGDMFTQTKGVNTQKGIIFLMGISLFCAGYVLREMHVFQPDLFRDTVRTLCRDLVKNEFDTQKSDPTHGELCFQKYHVGGVRQEVQEGFPTVFQFGLPCIEKEGRTDDKTLKITLLSLISELNDTNILHRSNKQVLQELQEKSRRVGDDFSPEGYAEIIKFCEQHQISPGGSADLLSIAIFVFLLKTNNFK